MDAGIVVTLGDASDRRELTVASARRHKRQILIRFDGVEDVDSLIGADVYIERSGVELKSDEYFDDDLVGCTLVDAAGAELGVVVGVLHYPAQDVLVVGERRSLVPLVGEFIRGIDVERKRIDVALPDGLIE